MVTPDELGDPQRLPIRCLVNGQVMQEANTSDMHFPVRTLISYCSHSFTLHPGDIIATGTPPGVGVFRKPPVLLGDGDEVAVEIGGIGRLSNRCRHLARNSPRARAGQDATPATPGSGA